MIEWQRAAAESLAPFWKTAGAQPGLLGAALDVAAGLDAAETAAMLLEPFRVEAVAQEHAAGLAAVARRYGGDWTRAVVDGWFGPGHPHATDRREWVDRPLPGLCETLRATGSPEVARLLAARAWTWMADQLRLWTTTGRSDSRRRQLEILSLPLVRLLEAADDTLRDEIAEALREYGDNVLECLMPALRLAHTRRAAGLDTIARDCADRLRTIIAQPLRDVDDWSIDWSGDGCDLCDTLRNSSREPSMPRSPGAPSSDMAVRVRSPGCSARSAPVARSTTAKVLPSSPDASILSWISSASSPKGAVTGSSPIGPTSVSHAFVPPSSRR